LFEKIIIAALLSALGIGSALSHEAEHFSAGKPGDAKDPSRIVKVIMREEGNRMLFEPSHVDIRKGEQIRFVLENDGVENHEFVLATPTENLKHAALMRKHPKMEHDDPNAKRLAPFANAEMIWKFTKAGTFEFSCLIPGHREAGMVGTITVK
jgi:uncharacterized cupredoxin-like copper-binding protein